MRTTLASRASRASRRRRHPRPSRESRPSSPSPVALRARRRVTASPSSRSVRTRRRLSRRVHGSLEVLQESDDVSFIRGYAAALRGLLSSGAVVLGSGSLAVSSSSPPLVTLQSCFFFDCLSWFGVLRRGPAPQRLRVSCSSCLCFVHASLRAFGFSTGSRSLRLSTTTLYRNISHRAGRTHRSIITWFDTFRILLF